MPTRLPAGPHAAPSPARRPVKIDVRPVYQPIVDLRTGLPVAFEALARGPAGTPVESPAALFAAARRHGLLVELDERCREAAVAGAERAGIVAPLFVNVEPDALRAGGVDGLRRLVAMRAGSRDLVLEVTERALTRSPADLLYFLNRARDLGLRVALDDVGVDPRSVALMPLVRPDVIKLDMSIVQEPPNRRAAAVLMAVTAECERSGAPLLAEGIETEEHLARARALGASLGQGWLFGRPEPVPDRVGAGTLPMLSTAAAAAAAETPFAAIAPRVRTQLADWRYLLEISNLMEDRAGEIGEEAVVLGAFQHARRFTPDTAVRYAWLARRAAFVAAFGIGLGPEPATRVRGAELRDDDPLAGEWSVVVLGAHMAAALVARETPLRHNGSRVFEYAVTHDRGLAADAAHSLMRRVVPVGPARGAGRMRPA